MLLRRGRKREQIPDEKEKKNKKAHERNGEGLPHFLYVTLVFFFLSAGNLFLFPL
jgi:hypothetical protein